MFNFFRSRKGKKSASSNEISKVKPEWLDYMDSSSYLLFLDHVNDYFQSKELEYTIDDGVISPESNDLGFNNMGIRNLTQICVKHDDKKVWKKLIFDHFDSLERIHKVNRNFDKSVQEFELISSYLAIRLVPKDYFQAIGKDKIVGKEITENIMAMVVFDLPESTTNIQPKYLNAWNKTEEEIFKYAIENTLKNYPLEEKNYRLDNVDHYHFTEDHFFTGTNLLNEKWLNDKHGEHGFLFIVPTRHTMIFYPIQSLMVTKAVNQLIGLVLGIYKDGPGSISDDLYWFYQGQIIKLPFEVKDELKFMPPDSFIKMLENLASLSKAEAKNPRILPRIKVNYSHEIYKGDTGAFLGNRTELSENIPEKFLPISMTLTADLLLLFGVDEGDTYTLLNQEFFEKNPNISKEEMKQLAIRNLATEIGDKIQIKGNPEEKIMLICGGNFEATLLLLDDLWSQLHAQMGEELYIILPTRDVLIVSPDPRQIESMKEIVSKFFNDNSEFLTSKAIYRRLSNSNQLEIIDQAF